MFKKLPWNRGQKHDIIFENKLEPSDIPPTMYNKDISIIPIMIAIFMYLFILKPKLFIIC